MKGFKKGKKDLGIHQNSLNNIQLIELFKKACNHHSNGDIQKAEEYYKILVNNQYNNPGLYSNYAVIFQQKRDLEKAIKLYEKSISLNPNNPIAYNNLGSIYTKKGNLKKAEELISRAIKQKPNFHDALTNLGFIYITLKKLKEAEKYTRKALSINPNSSMALNNLATILFEFKEFKDAEKTINKAINTQPKFPEALNLLGKIYIESNKLEEAEQHLRHSIKLNPKYADAYLNLAIALNKMQRKEEAKKTILSSLTLNSNNASAHYHLGVTNRDLGEFNNASIALLKAINIDPSLIDIQIFQGRLYRDIGLIQKSNFILQKAYENESSTIGNKSEIMVDILINSVISRDFKLTKEYLIKIKEIIIQDGFKLIENKKNKIYSKAYYNFIFNLFQNQKSLTKKVANELIPHIGDSHCLSYSNQEIYISNKIKTVQPILITGAKAWHFANTAKNKWKESLVKQIQFFKESEEIFISFGEIDCRRDEGILYYSIKNKKEIEHTYQSTIKGYVSFMENTLSNYFKKRYYFGIPAATKIHKEYDGLDIARTRLIKSYNDYLKQEVLSNSSYFIDVFKMTSDNNFKNNDIYMCDDIHLSPRYLHKLFKEYLYSPDNQYKN